MKRIPVYVVALLIVAAIAAVPALAWQGGRTKPAEETTEITSYDADFDLARNGELGVTETIAVRFPGHLKHGIFRFWDRNDASAPHSRRQPHDITVTRDGQSEPFALSYSDHGRYRVAKIGDADTTIDEGVHTYVLHYTMDNAIIPGTSADTDEPSEFYWSLVPGGWQQRIDKARLVVHLPVASPATVDCAVGFGTSTGCTATGVGTTTLVVALAGLDPRTPVTLRTGLAMAPPTTIDQLPWSTRLDDVLGRSVPELVLVLLLTLVVAVGAGLLGASTREPKPAFPLLYAPPDGIGPAQAAYVMNEVVDHKTYVATMMYAAEKGAVDLARTEDTWTIKDKAGATGWAGLDAVTFGTAHILGGPGSSFVAGKKDVSAGQRLKTEIASFISSTSSWGQTTQTVVPSGLRNFGSILVLGALALAGYLIIGNPQSMTMWALVPAAFAVCAGSLVRSGAGTKRTTTGRELWSRVGGFHRVLSTPSSRSRFEFSGRQELYTEYLPWAVAFGCADAWAEKYKTEMGADPPVPAYFGGYYVGSSLLGNVDSMVDDFNSTVDSAISSYNATQSSSSGGGFGGGGGGGGGGGSW